MSRVGKAALILRQLESERKMDALPRAERRAYENTVREASTAGATLRHNGVGGIPFSLALGIYRRDEWRCKKCSDRDDLVLHHKGGIQTSRQAPKGKVNHTSNVVVLCHACHNAVHDEDREKLRD